MNIFEIIEDKIPELPKKQKMIAEYMKANPDKMAYTTLKDISRETGVTEMTILNTCQSLGFQGLNDVKYEFRKENIKREKTDVFEDEYAPLIPVYERNRREKLLEEIGNEEVKMITSFWKNLDLNDIIQAAEILRSRKRVFICGRGFSFYLGDFFSKRMIGCDFFPICINTELNDDVYRLMECMNEEMLLVAVSFPDYYFMTDKIAQRAKEKGIKVLAFTDRKDADIAQYADFVLTVPTLTRGSLNTMSAAMMLVNLLISALNIVDSSEEL
ncbi:MAG: MurR/RpiR family transcriptional regulator [Lachnospiraceae bacterium]|nr:MurR/RpiR family transcriptional regulator [Lachnospiraceae bacterium]